MSNTWKVFSLQLAAYLCDKGFRIVGTVPNIKKPWLKVYVFENSEALQEEIDEWRVKHGR